MCDRVCVGVVVSGCVVVGCGGGVGVCVGEWGGVDWGACVGVCVWVGVCVCV